MEEEDLLKGSKREGIPEWEKESLCSVTIEMILARSCIRLKGAAISNRGDPFPPRGRKKRGGGAAKKMQSSWCRGRGVIQQFLKRSPPWAIEVQILNVILMGKKEGGLN